MPNEISIGQVLVERNAFETVSQQSDAMSSVRSRAARMVTLMDEIIERRELEAEQRCNECGHIHSEHGEGMEPACYWETCNCTGFKPRGKEAADAART